MDPSERGVHSITRYSLPNFGDHSRTRPEDAIILHIDIDAFYAQVEQEDYNLRGIPVIIGAWNSPQGNPRGIVATASYEARKFGIRTGMTHLEAQHRCPYLVALRINYEKYRSISYAIFRTLKEEFPEVERYSMDEFFVLLPKPTSDGHETAKRIQQQLKNDFGLTTSIGAAGCKSYAKLASALDKPAGLTILLDDETLQKRVYPLSIDHICGIGAKRAEKLKTLQVHTIQDAIHRGKGPFQSLFGPHLGQLMWQATVGEEVSPLLEASPGPKEYHQIHTFNRATTDLEQLKGELMQSIALVCQRMRHHKVAARKWEVYLRFEDSQREGVPIPFALREFSCCDTTVFVASWKYFGPICDHFISLNHRMLGVGITALDPKHQHQQTFHLDSKPDPNALFTAIDTCNARVGGSVVKPAPLLFASKERVHFIET